jgi:RNA recognition motif-containing protein
MEVKLYVGNLAQTTTGDDLRTVFAQVGTVTAVNVIMDRLSGQSKGFAFVTMGSQAEAQKAISVLNAFTLHERELKVSVAKPREERNSFGNRGGAFGNGGARNVRSHGRRGGSRRY